MSVDDIIVGKEEDREGFSRCLVFLFAILLVIAMWWNNDLDVASLMPGIGSETKTAILASFHLIGAFQTDVLERVS